MGRNDKIVIEAEVLHETDMAWLVDTGEVDDDDKPIGVWVPKSKCDFDEDGDFHIPEWLAEKRGLI